MLARDRFGVKPLFWTREIREGDSCLLPALILFYFADNWQPELDFDSFALYLRFGYIPAPYSIWKNTSSLPQAHFLEVTKMAKDLFVIGTRSRQPNKALSSVTAGFGQF